MFPMTSTWPQSLVKLATPSNRPTGNTLEPGRYWRERGGKIVWVKLMVSLESTESKRVHFSGERCVGWVAFYCLYFSKILQNGAIQGQRWPNLKVATPLS